MPLPYPVRKSIWAATRKDRKRGPPKISESLELTMAGRSTPISFDDAELVMVRAAAAPLPPFLRGPFLAAVAAELVGKERGAGLLYRVCVETQRQFLNGNRPSVHAAPSHGRRR